MAQAELDTFEWRLLLTETERWLEAGEFAVAEALARKPLASISPEGSVTASAASELFSLSVEAARAVADFARATDDLLALAAFLEARLGPDGPELFDILSQLDQLAPLVDPERQGEIQQLRSRLEAIKHRVLGAPGDASVAAASTEAKKLVTVHYATHRQPTGMKEAGRYYGGRRGSLAHGLATAAVRPNPDLEKVPSLSIWRLQRRSRWRDRAFLQEIVPATPLLFRRNLLEALANSKRREMLLFIHGFNVSFRAAVETTAILAVDLDLDGAPLLYSWPSHGNVLSYFVDRNNLIRRHVDALADLLVMIASLPDAGPLTVVAHSLGNQFLLSALEIVRERAGGDAAFVNTLIFAAPDVDRDDFADRATRVVGCAGRSALYASRSDRALWLSMRLQEYERAGDARRPLVVDGIDTIDTSEVSDGFIGHADFTTSAIDDVRSQVWFALDPPQRRPILDEVVGPDGTFWRMAADPDDGAVFGMAMVLCRRMGAEAANYVDALIAAAPSRNSELRGAGVRLRDQVASLLGRVAHP